MGRIGGWLIKLVGKCGIDTVEIKLRISEVAVQLKSQGYVLRGEYWDKYLEYLKMVKKVCAAGVGRTTKNRGEVGDLRL